MVHTKKAVNCRLSFLNEKESPGAILNSAAVEIDESFGDGVQV